MSHDTKAKASRVLPHLTSPLVREENTGRAQWSVCLADVLYRTHE